MTNKNLLEEFELT